MTNQYPKYDVYSINNIFLFTTINLSLKDNSIEYMKKVLLALAILISVQATAQDVHFTQYFTSPLTLNPANTGLVNCDWRLSGNYRSQWGAVNSVPYLTGTVSYDMALMKNKLRGDALGIGVLGMFDRAGSGALQNITTGLSLAYHKKLGDDPDRPQTLSIGVQGYLVQKSVDQQKLTFESMWDPVSGQVIYFSGENITQMDPYPDFNAGIMYSGRLNEKATLYAGGSYYHITRPTESFLGSDYQIHSRITATLGGSFQMNDNTVLYASSMYQQQGKASELLVGAATGFILNPSHEDAVGNTIFYLGAWYRYNDAVAPYIGFEWSKAKLGLSYDVNLSSFTPATQGQGALELSLIYSGCIIRNVSRTYNFECPRF